MAEHIIENSLNSIYYSEIFQIKTIETKQKTFSLIYFIIQKISRDIAYTKSLL